MSSRQPALGSRRLAAASVSVAAAVVLAGCTGVAGSNVTAPPTAQDRVAAIVRARDEVVAPAQSLGTAAAEVAARLDDLVARPDEATAQAVRASVALLERARAEVAGLALEPQTADVAAAAASLGAAAAGADRLGAATGEVVDAVTAAADLDAQLDDLVAVWDEPGSRSQLLERLAASALRADELASAPRSDPTEGCAGPVEARRQLAAFVAEATRDLHGLVERRDGAAFDERRTELADAPFGTDDDGRVRGPGAAIDPDACPAVGRAQDAATEVVRGLRDLQRALNPSDLAG